MAPSASDFSNQYMFISVILTGMFDEKRWSTHTSYACLAHAIVFVWEFLILLDVSARISKAKYEITFESKQP